MENLVMSEKRRKKIEGEKSAPVISKEIALETLPSIAELIGKCDELIEQISALYFVNSDKSLSDAVILLYSAKNSLNVLN